MFIQANLAQIGRRNNTPFFISAQKTVSKTNEILFWRKWAMMPDLAE